MLHHPGFGKTRSIGAVLFLLSVSCHAPIVSAQSFDCQKAATKAEHAICDNPELAALDFSLSASLRELLAAQPASRAAYLKDEREWIKERDHNCSAPSATHDLSECLLAQYKKQIAVIGSRLSLSPGQPANTQLGSSQSSHVRLCQIIADQYRPLANSHPGERPLHVVSSLPNSGVRLDPGNGWDDLHAADLPKWAAAQKPPFVVSQALVTAVKQYQEEGGTARLLKVPGIAFYSFAGTQGSAGCAFSQSFVVQAGVAVPTDTLEESGEDNCGTGLQYGTVDSSTVAMVENYDWRPGMTASIDLWRWTGQEFTSECKISLTYTPHFSPKTLNSWGETCEGNECDDLRTAAFKLAESAEHDPQALQRHASAGLTAKQKEQFDAMNQLFTASDQERVSNDGFNIPFPHHDHVYLVSIGHFAIGWRDFADWSVRFFELRDANLTLRAGFPVGTLKGNLAEMTVAEQ